MNFIYNHYLFFLSCLQRNAAVLFFTKNVDKAIVFALLLLFVHEPVFSLGGKSNVEDFIEYAGKLQKELLKNSSSGNQKKISDEMRAKALELLDTDEIAKMAILEYYQLLTQEQKQEYTRLFNKLIAYHITNAYIPIEKFTANQEPVKITSQMELRDEIFQKDAYVIQTSLKINEMVYTIHFYLYQKNKVYKLYDIHYDDNSLLLDYQKQFTGIVRKYGIDYLLKKMDERYKKLVPEQSDH